jgi:hypothetical protein
MAVAKRRSGKSTWSKEFLSKIPQTSTGTCIVIAGTEATKKAWGSYTHPIYIHDATEPILKKLIDIQNRRVLQCERDNTPFDDRHNVTVICDDVSSTPDFMKSRFLGYLASNARHLRITLMIITQYLVDVPTYIRTQVEYLILLATSDKRSISRINDEYVPSTQPRIFRAVLSACTQNYDALIVDNTGNPMSMESHCFYSKVDRFPLPDMKFGSTQSWEWANTHYCDTDKLHMHKNPTIPNSVEDESYKDEILFDSDDLDIIMNKQIFRDRKGTITIIKSTPKQKRE